MSKRGTPGNCGPILPAWERQELALRRAGSAQSLTPGDPLFEPGVENILVSSSTAQARIVLEFARAALGEVDGYRWRADGVVHLRAEGAGTDRF